VKKMTEDNVKAAFAGESQAHLKYLAFAAAAEKEGLTNIARLFRAASYSEQMHATNHLGVLKGVGKTSENLQGAIDGETFEVTEMYPAYIATGNEQQEKVAVMWFNYALAAEKVHAGLYKRAKENADTGKDLGYFPVHVCGQCGFTVEGEAPERCPVCGAPKEKFVRF
jgi:rubrerythrin